MYTPEKKKSIVPSFQAFHTAFPVLDPSILLEVCICYKLTDIGRGTHLVTKIIILYGLCSSVFYLVVILGGLFQEVSGPKSKKMVATGWLIY